jgi:DNA repair protein RadC
MKKTFTIHDLPAMERPRERLSKLGVEALSAQEIISLILGRGTAGESVTILAQKLLSVFGDIKNMSAASPEQLMKIKGIGPAKAAQLVAAFEIGKRMEIAGEAVHPQVTKPEIIIAQIKPLLKGKKKEYFILVSLDTRNRIITRKTVSIGSLNSSIVHPREVFKEALAASAASVIFVHNHPSGDPTPSDDDIAITQRLADAGKILGIDVLDHIIICDNAHVSMKARNLY